MPKFPPIPRLSIVIPIGPDLAAFERTLVSVLENQPSATEVIVAHDGHYDDPFDLCDEVRFVVAGSDRPVDLVASAATEARGRFVHVLADGVRATSGWTDAAIDGFEPHDAGVVIPVIRREGSGEIVAAGWRDRASRLCDAVAAGKKEVDSRNDQATGAYLQASFWRRDLLRSLAGAFSGSQDGLEATYAFGQLVRSAGWQCVTATDSTLESDWANIPYRPASMRQGMRLAAIRAHFETGGWLGSLADAAWSFACNVTRPAEYGPSIGRAFAPLGSAKVARELDRVTVPRGDDVDEVIMSIPAANCGHQDAQTRQAA